MIGNYGWSVTGAIGEGASDTLAFLLTGNDVMGAYVSNNTNGIRRQRCAARRPWIWTRRGPG